MTASGPTKVTMTLASRATLVAKSDVSINPRSQAEVAHN